MKENKMTNRQNKIKELERIATEASEALKEARAGLRKEKRQEDISQCNQALTILLQTGAEVSHEMDLVYLDRYCTQNVRDEWVYGRTVVMYVPEEKSLKIFEGRKESIWTSRKGNWEEYGTHVEKEIISAKDLEKARSKIGSTILIALATDAETALINLDKFNSGDDKALNETVARMIIADRIKKGMQTKFMASSLKYTYPYCNKLSGAFKHLKGYCGDWKKYHSTEISRFPMGNAFSKRLFFCKGIDVFVDYNEHTPGVGEEAILYGKEKNTRDLKRFIKERDKYNVSGSGF